MVNSEVLLENLEQIRKQKFTSDNEDFADGMIAIAVPIKDKRGRL